MIKPVKSEFSLSITNFISKIKKKLIKATHTALIIIQLYWDGLTRRNSCLNTIYSQRQNLIHYIIFSLIPN